MAKQKTIEKIDEEAPQKSLEKILQTEIQITEMISEAKEKADKQIVQAQNKVASFKDNIIEQARADREEILTKGIADAKADSEKRVKKAQIDSEAFIKSGTDFINEAVLRVEAIILGASKSEDK